MITTTSTDLVTGGTRLTVIDTTTGTQVGTTLTLPGYRSATWSADGTHALTITSDGNETTGFTTRVVVIDTTTATQTGTPLTLTGGAAIYVTAVQRKGHPRTHHHRRRCRLHPRGGDQYHQRNPMGTTLTLAGHSPRGDERRRRPRPHHHPRRRPVTHASSTLVTIIDATTGNQIGTTLTLAGAPYSPCNDRRCRPRAHHHLRRRHGTRSSTPT